MTQLRETIWAMNNRSVSLDMLKAKLAEFTQRFNNSEQKITVALFASNPDSELGPTKTINVFRACQEAVNNAVKYAHFSELSIELRQKVEDLEITITDNGKGFNPSDELNKGYGLASMKQRLEEVNGQFLLKSNPELGTVITLTLPLGMLNANQKTFLPMCLKNKLALLFIGISGVLTAQSQDSLRLLLSKTTVKTDRFEMLMALSSEWMYQNLDSAKTYFEEANRLALKMDDEKALIEVANQRGNYLQRTSKDAEALKVYKEAIERSLAIGYDTGLAKLYNNVGLIYTQQAQYDLAFKEFLNANIYEEKNNNLKGLAQGLNNMGVVLYYQGEIEKSLEYFKQSVATHEQRKDPKSAKQGYNNIGAIYESLKEYQSALEYYNRALAIAQEINDFGEEAQGYNNIAGIYMAQKKFDKALFNYQKSKEINEDSKDYYSLVTNYVNLAKLYFELEKLEQCQTYFKLGLDLAKRNNYKKLEYEMYAQMAEFYKAAGLFGEAYNYLTLYHNAKDSVYNSDKAATIAEMQTKYETVEKEKALAENQAALSTQILKTKQRTFWLVTLAITALLIVIVGVQLIKQQRQKQTQLKNEAKLKNELAKAELKNRLEEERVRISRDLHDHIGAQLTIISSQLDNLSFKEADQQRKLIYDKISDHTRETMSQLRETIWAMNNEAVSLKMLMAKLKGFSQKLASPQRQIEITNHVPEHLTLSPAQTISVFRVCQEAINNAVKYAEFSKLEITATGQNEELKISLKDNGVGFKADEATLAGYGLGNMKERMEQVQGKLLIESLINQGTTVSLSLTVNTPNYV
jgi:signal transduction histidine kinase